MPIRKLLARVYVSPPSSRLHRRHPSGWILPILALGFLLLPAAPVRSFQAYPAPQAPAAPVAPATAPPPAAKPAPPPPSLYKPGQGPREVAKAQFDWVDEARHRPVPVTLYAPAGKEGGPFPVIVFSPGLGGTRDGYAYLGRYWASYGYVVVLVQHLGSDTEIWPDRRKAAVERPVDVGFVLDRLAVLNRDEPSLRGRLDLARVGMAGHSFGAWTTLALLGQVSVAPGGREVSFLDRRIQAAVSMSAPVTSSPEQYAVVYGNVKIPCFHMTGTKDEIAVDSTHVAQRRVPFDRIDGADQYLVTFRDGDHLVFSGRPRGVERDETLQSFIKIGSLAFWDAYLKGGSEARAWLSHGGFAGALGGEGVFEEKLK